MSNDTKDFVNSVVKRLSQMTYIRPDEIPDINLYMDQVTTFMEDHLNDAKRYSDDKILTKTMINNYAKNDLLPPPVKKKYSKEHMLLLIFIYYYKGILSINDIQTLLKPITEKYFYANGELNLGSVYEEVFSLEEEEVSSLKEDIMKKFETSQGTFENAPQEDREILQLFSFICMLSYDVYVKKLLIEKMVDSFGTAVAGEGKAERNNTKEKGGKEKREKEK